MPSADVIDYRLVGEDMQFVEIELDPGESAISEAGTMMYKAPSIEMTTIFGDGSGQEGGFMGKLVGAGKRVLTGESLFTTVFTHNGEGKAHVAFAAPYPGTILPIDLSSVGGRLICQKDAFLAAAKGVSVGLAFQKKIMTGLFGGEGFIMQKLEGDGMVFIHVGGTLEKRDLAAGETIQVDTEPRRTPTAHYMPTQKNLLFLLGTFQMVDSSLCMTWKRSATSSFRRLTLATSKP